MRPPDGQRRRGGPRRSAGRRARRPRAAQVRVARTGARSPPTRPRRPRRRSGEGRDGVGQRRRVAAGRTAGRSRPGRPGRADRPRPRPTTGTPLACASWTVWQNVSDVTGCTNTSSEAKLAASSAPPSMPVKVASGSRSLQPAALRPVADDHQLEPGIGQLDQSAHLLLGARAGRRTRRRRPSLPGPLPGSLGRGGRGRTGRARPRAATGAGSVRRRASSWAYDAARRHQRPVAARGAADRPSGPRPGRRGTPYWRAKPAMSVW